MGKFLWGGASAPILVAVVVSGDRGPLLGLSWWELVNQDCGWFREMLGDGVNGDLAVSWLLQDDTKVMSKPWGCGLVEVGNHFEECGKYVLD